MVATTSPVPERIAIVTGATSGIGREIAMGLAKRGDHVVVVGRGAERARQTAAGIAQETGNPRIDSIGVDDLARIAEVRRVAAELLAGYPRIHILVNNAGGYFAQRDVTADGLERTFALNVMAPFLLTSLLAERLKASAPARVVNISSAAHYRHKVDFADLQSAQRFAGFDVYGRSKLELLLLTREFARRFEGTGVTVNAVHPGYVASGFGQNNGRIQAIFFRFTSKIFGRSLRGGADTPVFVATDPSVERVTGQYFSRRKVHRGDAASRDPATAARLYAACEAIAKPTAPAGASG